MGSKKRTPKKRVRKRRDWKPAFLRELCRRGNVQASCLKAGIGRRQAYDARIDDPPFGEAWKDALEIACDALEEEAIRRAKDGVLEPLVSAGKLVTKCKKYSDTLLIFLLKAHRPGKYRERLSIDQSPIPPEWLDLLSDEELELVEKNKLSATQIAAIVATKRRGDGDAVTD